MIIHACHILLWKNCYFNNSRRLRCCRRCRCRHVCTLVRVLLIEANGWLLFGWGNFFCFAIISWHLHQNMNICQLVLLQREMIWNCACLPCAKNVFLPSSHSLLYVVDAVVCVCILYRDKALHCCTSPGNAIIFSFFIWVYRWMFMYGMYMKSIVHKQKSQAYWKFDHIN